MSRTDDWSELLTGSGSPEVEWFECAICRHVLEEPVTTCRGWTMCRRCFVAALKEERHAELFVKDVDMEHGYQDVKVKEAVELCCRDEVDAVRELGAQSGKTAEDLRLRTGFTVAAALELEAERQLKEGRPREALEALCACVVVRRVVTPNVAELYDRMLQEDTSCKVNGDVMKAARTRAANISTTDRERKLDDPELLQCFCCLQFLYEPCTLPTGHTVCRECLPRILELTDPSSGLATPPSCPFTKIRLDRYKAWIHEDENNLCTNRALELTSKLYFEKELAARRQQSVQDMDEYMSEDAFVPIFVCMVAFPHVKLDLHIFEPRYRLMMRRSIETGFRKFGMCAPTSYESFSPVGTMLYIAEQTVLPDGRSLVKTRGLRRFRVLEKSIKDGYHVARIEYFDDIDAPLGTAEPSGDEAALAEVRACAQECRELLVNRMGNGFLTDMAKYFGDMPTELGPQSFWMASLMCQTFLLDPSLSDYNLLQMNSLQRRWKRLRTVARRHL